MYNGEQKKIYFIGRSGDIRLDHVSASRHHASLEVSESRLVLRDLNSRNGTFEIRGERSVPITETQVFPDQIFAFGACIRSVREMLAEAGETGQWESRPIDNRPTSNSNVAKVEASEASEDSRTRYMQEKLAALLAADTNEDAATAKATEIDPATLPKADPNRDFDRTAEIKSIVALEHEIGLLRKMLDDVSRERDAVQRIADLSLERLQLHESLMANIETVKLNNSPLAQSKPSESTDENPELTERYFVSK